ncbi:MAG: T9SS type A sorting domain-containing protein [Saprospiraceae bacterium]|nr:T9SS type A sorting domain-containing protein [Saprospiraceae bacterium]
MRFFNDKTILVASILMLCLPLSAQLEWQRMPGPPGGFAYGSFGIGTGGKWLRLGATAGVYESADNGLNWKWNDYPGTIHTEAALALANDGWLWYFNFDRLSRSSNNGQTWIDVLDEGSTWTSTNVTATTVLDSGAIMLGIRGGNIVRSLDSSRTATNVLTGSFNSLIRNPQNGHLYAWKTAATAGQINPIRRSINNGQTWAIWENDALTTGKNITGIAFSPNGSVFLVTNGNLLRSDDDGVTWVELAIQPSHVVATNTGRLLAEVQSSPTFSDDNGATWQPLSYKDMRKFAVMPDGTIFTEYQYSGLYRSNDDGNTWQFSAYGMPNHVGAIKMHFFQDNHVMAITKEGVFYSENGANNWTMRRSTLGNEEDFYPGWQSVIVSDSAICIVIKDSLLKSADRGQTWQNITPPQFANNIDFTGFGVVDNVLFFRFLDADYNSITLRSEDSGVSWQNLGTIEINNPVMAPDGSFWSFASSNALYKSTDRGLTWSPIVAPSLSGGFFRIMPLLNGDILLLGGGKVLRSQNNGITWTTTNQNYMSNVGLALVINDTQLLVTGTQVGNSDIHLLSVDNGYTWRILSMPPTYWADNFIFMTPDQRLWVASGDGAWRSTEPVGDFLTMGGSVGRDQVENCTLAFTEPRLPGFKVKSTATNGAVRYGMSGADGYYRILTQAGDYTLTAIPPNDLWESCTITANVPNTQNSGNIGGKNIAIKAAVVCPRLEVNIATSILRRCFDTRMAINWRNTGTAPAPDSRLQVVLDPYLDLLASSFPVNAQSGDTLWYDLGTIPVNASETIYLDLNVSCDAALGQTHCTEAHITPDTSCLTWQGAILKTRMECLGDSVLLEIKNTGASDMTSPRKWQVWRQVDVTFDSLLVAEGNFFLTTGSTFTHKIAATNDAFLMLRAPQEADYPYGSAYAQSYLLNCNNSNNPPYAYATSDLLPSDDLFCLQNIGAYDPNDKTGFPAGVGAGHHIDQSEPLTYLIRFQNTGTDTAFTVVVRDTLSSWLDIETFQVDASSHPMTVNLRGANELVFRFDNILLPDSNINEAASHGFVRYSIRQKDNNPNGAIIKNRAGIYFDFNLPVMTNETRHTIGLPMVSGTAAEPHQGIAGLLTYPNPVAGDYFWVETSNDEPVNGFLDISDATGRWLRREVFSGNKMRIDSNTLPDGLIFLTLKNDQGLILANGRVVLVGR